eukprot:2233890-Rhodomonas_salina.1
MAEKDREIAEKDTDQDQHSTRAEVLERDPERREAGSRERQHARMHAVISGAMQGDGGLDMRCCPGTCTCDGISRHIYAVRATKSRGLRMRWSLGACICDGISGRGYMCYDRGAQTSVLMSWRWSCLPVVPLVHSFVCSPHVNSPREMHAFDAVRHACDTVLTDIWSAPPRSFHAVRF